MEGKFDVGSGGHDLEQGGKEHVGGASRGGTGALDMDKTVEWDGVGGIEMRGLHEVDGTDSTAKPDGYWEGNQFIQVRGDFDFQGIGLCEDDEGEMLIAFGKACMAGFGGCASDSLSVAASHRQVAVAHPQPVDYNDADNNDKYNDDNNNSAQQPCETTPFSFCFD